MNVKILSLLLVCLCFILSAGVRSAVIYTETDLQSSEDDKPIVDIDLPSQQEVAMSEMKMDNRSGNYKCFF